MKKNHIIIIIIIFFLSITMSAQKVYSVEYQNQVSKNEGKWFFTDYPNQDDKKIYFVEYANQADFKIYFVKYENQAGWNNKSKVQLMY